MAKLTIGYTYRALAKSALHVQLVILARAKVCFVILFSSSLTRGCYLSLVSKCSPNIRMFGLGFSVLLTTLTVAAALNFLGLRARQISSYFGSAKQGWQRFT